MKNAESNTTAFSKKEKTTILALRHFLGITRHRYVEAIKTDNKMMIMIKSIKNPPAYLSTITLSPTEKGLTERIIVSPSNCLALTFPKHASIS